MAEAAADLLISELLALGLLTALNGAFALALPIWVWLGVAALCAAWPTLHRVPLSKAGRYGAALALAASNGLAFLYRSITGQMYYRTVASYPKTISGFLLAFASRPSARCCGSISL